MSTDQVYTPLKSHEDFSLTGMLLNETQQWHQGSDLGSFGARVVNLIATPLTALIDAVVHLALGAFSIAGLSQMGWLYDQAAWIFSSESRSPITFKGGLINIYQGLRHTIGMVAAPLLGLSQPKRASEFFQHLESQHIAQQKSQVIDINFKLMQEKRAKGHVIDNVKKACLKNKDLKIKLKASKEIISAKDREIGFLKGRAKGLAKSGHLAIQGQIKATNDLLAKIQELEHKVQNLEQTNAQLQEQNNALLTAHTKESNGNWNFLPKSLNYWGANPDEQGMS